MSNGKLNLNFETKNEFLKDYPDIIGVKELSAIFKISTKSANKLLKDKNIGYVLIGRKKCIPKINIVDLFFQ